MQDTQFKNQLIDIIDEKIAESGGGGGGLPEVTAADNGKVLGVAGGEWQAVTPSAGGGSAIAYAVLLPDQTEIDDGRIDTYYKIQDASGNALSTADLDYFGYTFIFSGLEINNAGTEIEENDIKICDKISFAHTLGGLDATSYLTQMMEIVKYTDNDTYIISTGDNVIRLDGSAFYDEDGELYANMQSSFIPIQ